MYEYQVWFMYVAHIFFNNFETNFVLEIDFSISSFFYKYFI